MATDFTEMGKQLAQILTKKEQLDIPRSHQSYWL